MGVLKAGGIGLAAAGISKGLELYSKYLGRAKEASDAARELAKTAQENVASTREQSEQVDSLVEKYRELKASGQDDSETRSQIADIQQQIVGIVGEQAGALDLVNGNLDTELGKLREIQEIEAQRVAESASAAYTSARDSSGLAVGDTDIGLLGFNTTYGLSNLGRIREKEVEQILHRNGYSNNLLTRPLDDNLYLNTSIDEAGNALTGAQEQLALVSRMMRDIRNEFPDYRGSSIYSNLQKAYDYFDKYVSTQRDAAQSALLAEINAQSQTNDELSKLQINSLDDYNAYQDKLVGLLQNSPRLKAAILDGMITESDIRDQVTQYLSSSSDFAGWAIQQSNADKRQSIFDTFGKAADRRGLSRKAYSEFQSWLNSLSGEELNVVYTASLDEASASYSFEDWKKLLEDQIAEEPIALEVDFAEEQTGMKSVLDAIKESVAQTGLGEESIGALTNRYKDLAGANFDASKLFEVTANGIHLNAQELSRLESTYENLTKSNIDSYLQDLVNQYNDLTDQINNADKATDTSDLYKQRNDIADLINSTQALAAQYNGLTSAYNKWKNAQSMGEEGDMYDDITSNLKNIKELYDEGLIGTNKFRAAVGLMTNEDVSGMSADELVAIYDKAYPKMERYFKDGQTGVENFLNDINKLNSSWASMDENGVWNLDFNADEVAKQLGISTEGLEIIMRKLKDFGFDVNLEGVGEGLDKHVTDIDSAVQALDEAKTKLKEDLTSGDITVDEFAKQTKQINEAEEAIKSYSDAVSDAGTETLTIDQALDKISELQSVIATLTSNGITIPVVLEGQYEDLSSLISSLGYKEGENGENGQSGSFELHVSDPEDAAGKIAEIQKAIDTINANPNIDANIKAAVTTAGNATVAELQKIVDAPDSSSKTITLSATDEATPVITTITDGDYSAKVKTSTDGTAETQIQAIEDGDYTVTFKTKFEFGDGGTVDPRELSDEEIAEYQKEHGEYSIPMLVDDSLQSGADKAIDTLDDVQEVVEETKSSIAEGWEWGIDEGLASQYSTIEELVARQNQTQSTAIPIDMSTIQSAGKGVSALVDAANKANVGAGFINALSNAYSNLASAMQAANEADPLDTNQTSVAAADLQEAATAFQTALSNVAEQTFASGDIPDVEIDADTSLAMAKIADLSSTDCEVVYNPNTRAVDAYRPKNKSATVNYSANFSGISAPTLNGTVIYTRKYVGSDTTVTQSAKATGNAFPMGTLGGEVGRELVVRNGRWFTIGDNGAEFFDYQNGDIIFNASQTDELLRTGRVRSNGGRGLIIGDDSAYASGNAFALVEDTTGSKRTASASNTTASGKFQNTTTKKSTSSSSSSRKNKSSSSTKKKDKKSEDNTFDWIEVAIERIEREITNLSRVAESSFRTLAQRLTATEKQIAATYNEIAIQQQASDYYMQKADSVGLSDALKKKVREGAIDIKSYKEETQKLITEYKEWYLKMPLHAAMHVDNFT